ncbi:MAG: hypothetical protein JSV89_07255 [Spirochaetaceae bacterium]|nr:MAG: hypothetical protein JSV89_07255 [Spirochaetaceae bacterium]
MDSPESSAPYTSEPAGTAVFRLDEKSQFKLYFLQIIGRVDRSRYEWATARRSKEQTIVQLRAHSLRGIGFACVFPHIAKVFFFGSSQGHRETNLYVRAFGGDPLQPISLEYGESMEIACAGEMDVASKEFALWQRCSTVEQYLEEFVSPSICCFENHEKLKSFLL